jgi:hypothetical protein
MKTRTITGRDRRECPSLIHALQGLTALPFSELNFGETQEVLRLLRKAPDEALIPFFRLI